jgi:hypothetical protein
MKKKSLTLFLLLLVTLNGQANDELQLIQKELAAIKQEYESRISSLEQKLYEAQQKLDQQGRQIETQEIAVENMQTASTPTQNQTSAQNTFNPAISLIVDGRFVDYAESGDGLSFPGFALGPEVGKDSEGFNLGESELMVSANVDDKFYGQATIAFGNDAGETEVELEEMYLQTLSLNHGLTLKAGRFFSSMGYLNEQHAHAWDFADAPLVYQAMLAGKLKNEGVQLRMVLPTDFYLEAGIEAGNGRNFPASGDHNGLASQTAFLTTGGDIGFSHSWQLGLSHWQATVSDRLGLDENPDFTFNGDIEINSLDFVYKWAPNGNNKQQNIKFQFEYFDRDENGVLGETEVQDYAGKQSGWYAQVAWLFKPQWRVGFRYDEIDSNNRSLDLDRLEQAGLLSAEVQNRSSIMMEWIPSEFSRFRMQFNDRIDRLNSQAWVFQYTYSIGSHGAHQF